MMDTFEKVRELSPVDAADHVNLDTARNALHREVARATSRHRTRGRRLGFALGGGVTALAGAVVAGIVIGGGAGVVTAVAPVVPEPATAATILLTAADMTIAAGDPAVPAGSYLRAESVYQRLATVNTEGVNQEGGFSSMRAGATGASIIERARTLYVPGDAAQLSLTRLVPMHPITTFGDAAAVAAQWNGGVLKDEGTYAEALATAPAADVYVTPADGVASWIYLAQPPTGSDLDAMSPIDSHGDYPTDPRAFLTAWTEHDQLPWPADILPSLQLTRTALEHAQSTGDTSAIDPMWVFPSADPAVSGPAVTQLLATVNDQIAQGEQITSAAQTAIAGWSAAEREAATRESVGELILATQTPEFATAPAEYRATVLRAIALSSDLTIERTDGDITTVTFTGAHTRMSVRVDTAMAQLVAVDTFNSRDVIHDVSDPANAAKDTTFAVGSSPLIPADVPDGRYTLTVAVVDTVPALTPEGDGQH